MFANRRKGGFTLPEVLVTVAIVAVLAAIVVPTVTNQLSKGDDANLPSNATSLRTAITAFVTDTRKFPGRLQHLQTPINNTDLDISGSQYGAAAEQKWNGPYLAGGLKPAAASPQDSINWALAFAIDSLRGNMLASVAPFPNNTSGLFLTLGGVGTRAQARHIDSLIDGGNDSTAGSLRWRSSNGAGDPTNARLYYLIMGIQ
jgi:prepilin-type N-terminal cleavage/methylation domain-containing protein